MNITSICLGVYNTFVASKDAIYAFGLNNYSQLGETDSSPVDDSSSNTCFFTPHLIKSLSAEKWNMLATGQHHSLALNAEGKIYAFGRHDYGRLGLKSVTEPVTKPTLIPSLQDKKIKFIATGEYSEFFLQIYSLSRGRLQSRCSK